MLEIFKNEKFSGDGTLFDVHCFNLTKEELDEFINWKELKDGYIVQRAGAESSSASSQDFKKSLTAAEKEALTALLKENKMEGIVSFSALSEKTGVARHVFSSLANKMKINNVAVVRGCGVKGTYIKIIETSICE